ncbi:hypothetical protein GCM10008013_00560 [Paenibacillus segetis]|uniref:Uncharacterized protein n=1 Tax=Paenibacillus segetis TaxID=1325360 RepID=A0ABQ1Y1F8_9BACL|nr:hypothetical protein GCM10008013_00560 [Paenibacillus segetis]
MLTHGELPGAAEQTKDKVMHMVLTVAGGKMLFLAVPSVRLARREVLHLD